MNEASDSVEIQEVVQVGHQTDSSGSTSPTISEQVSKFFPIKGCLSGNIDGIRQDDNGNIYKVLFADDNTEEWRQEKYDKNAAYAHIPISDVGLRFIKKFAGGYFFSGRVVGIQSNDKHKVQV